MRESLVHFAGAKPKCFTSHEQYKDWRKLARGTVTNKTFGPCIDCTPKFQQDIRSRHPTKSIKFGIYI